MAAVAHRERTGEGQFIDLAQIETCVATIGDVMLAALEGEQPLALGNRRSVGAPYGIYPCAGEDRWVAISIGTDDEWEALCRLAGRPEWNADERLRTLPLRLQHADFLDRIVADWTRTRKAESVMELLQAAGLAAGVAQNVEDLVRADPHLAARDFFEEIPHRAGGHVRASRPGFRLEETGGHTPDTGRGIGADNDRILREWLSLAPDEVALHRRSGALED